MDETDVKKPTPQGLGVIAVLFVAMLGFAAVLNAFLLIPVVRWILCLAVSGTLVAIFLTSRKPGV